RQCEASRGKSRGLARGISRDRTFRPRALFHDPKAALMVRMRWAFVDCKLKFSGKTPERPRKAQDVHGVLRAQSAVHGHQAPPRDCSADWHPKIWLSLNSISCPTHNWPCCVAKLGSNPWMTPLKCAGRIALILRTRIVSFPI